MSGLSSYAGLLTHGIGGRKDLPISFHLALYGAGAAVLVSFLVLLVAWKTPRFQSPGEGPALPGWLARSIGLLRVPLGVLGAVSTLAVIGCGVLGTFTSDNNIAASWLYIVVWLGLVATALFLGPVYVWFNPARAIHAGLCKAAGIDPHEGSRPCPDTLLPAALQLFAFAWLELTTRNASNPRTVAIFLALQLVVNLVAGVVYGDGWFSTGDGFEVYARFVGAMSPWTRDEDGTIRLRTPLSGLAALPRRRGTVAVMCTLIGSTAFDGTSNTTGFYNATIDLQTPHGLGRPVVYTLCLMASIAIFTALYTGGLYAAEAIAGQRGHHLATSFAHTLIPIAVGYVIAHYFSLLVFNGQDVLRLLGDPAGEGWRLLPTTDWKIDYTVISASAIALTKVGGIVAGHLLGVLTAHDHSVAVMHRRPVLSQVPLLVVMITMTLTAVVILLQ